MKKLKRILVTILAFIVIIAIGGLVFIDLTLPSLPPLTNKIIDKALEKNNYRLKGEEGYAINPNDSTKIWYETISPEDSVVGHVILIMGIANDAMAWPDYFIDPMIDSGYNVIKFDARGTGKSDWLENWNKETAYTLEDIADDIISIIDTLKIEKVHIVGISFGGMVGQTTALKYPHRVHSLVSISSTGDIMDDQLPGMDNWVLSQIIMSSIRYTLVENDENNIKNQITVRMLLSGNNTYDFDLENMIERLVYNLHKREGYNPDASKQQTTAVMLSGSRYKDLNELSIPTLVIHGKDDPLIPIEHGKKTFAAIPDADSLLLDNMGHDIPLSANDVIVKKIIDHFHKIKPTDE
jgi:pimeloyl-ACP methyl ester carboxylesterase